MVRWKELCEVLEHKKEAGRLLQCLLIGFLTGYGTAIFKWVWFVALFFALAVVGVIYYMTWLTAAIITYVRERKERGCVAR